MSIIPRRMNRPRRMDAQPESMFPHTVTIYNVITREDPAQGFRPKRKNYMTILRGVLLDASKAVNVNKSGLEGADAVDLIIPFDVEAVDGVTGEEKTYIGPMEFWSREDIANLWTMSLDGQGEGDTFFVKGEVMEPNLTFEGVSLKYDGVYNITKVDELDYGGLPHWEVGGV